MNNGPRSAFEQVSAESGSRPSGHLSLPDQCHLALRHLERLTVLRAGGTLSLAEWKMLSNTFSCGIAGVHGRAPMVSVRVGELLQVYTSTELSHRFHTCNTARHARRHPLAPSRSLPLGLLSQAAVLAAFDLYVNGIGVWTLSRAWLLSVKVLPPSQTP